MMVIATVRFGNYDLLVVNTTRKAAVKNLIHECAKSWNTTEARRFVEENVRVYENPEQGRVQWD